MPKPKSLGQREQTKAPSEPSKSSALAEQAAARGFTETELIANYLSSLKLHGERVEDRVGKEFQAWLFEFAKVVAANKSRTDAWQELKSRCDVLLLLQDLYLFTYPEDSEHAAKKTTADVLKDSCRFLKEELDKLIPRYGTLHKDTSELFADPKLRLLGVLSGEINTLFEEPITLLQTAQQELKVMRNWAEKMGSLKTEANDAYLYSLATRVRKSTGEYHFPELTTLVEAALAAHGEADEEALDHETLERRVQRYIKRMNLSHRVSSPQKPE